MQGDTGKNFDVGERLREERIRFGRGQEEFGAWFGGVSAKTVGNWERNVGAPDARQISEASTHGVDAMYLLTGKRSASVEAPTADYHVDSRAENSASPALEHQNDALRAALLNTITSSRSRGHRLTTDQFIRVVQAMFVEYLQELESGTADIGCGDDAAEPRQTGTTG